MEFESEAAGKTVALSEIPADEALRQEIGAQIEVIQYRATTARRRFSEKQAVEKEVDRYRRKAQEKIDRALSSERKYRVPLIDLRREKIRDLTIEWLRNEAWFQHSLRRNWQKLTAKLDAREWVFETRGVVQPLQVNVRCLRGIRRRLEGRFFVKASVCSALGEPPMKFTNLHSPIKDSTTLIQIDNKWSTFTCDINQDLQIVAPSRREAAPSLILLFQVFHNGAHPRTVAWGAFPLLQADGRFAVGKFKTFLVHGEVDLNVRTFAALESVADRLHFDWLGTIYFSISSLAKDSQRVLVDTPTPLSLIPDSFSQELTSLVAEVPLDPLWLESAFVDEVLTSVAPSQHPRAVVDAATWPTIRQQHLRPIFGHSRVSPVAPLPRFYHLDASEVMPQAMELQAFRYNVEPKSAAPLFLRMICFETCATPARATLSLALFALALLLRAVPHYLILYFYLVSAKTGVVLTSFDVFGGILEYVHTSRGLAFETSATFIAPFGVLLSFVALVSVISAVHSTVHLPRPIHLFGGLFGFAVVVDPVVTIIHDIAKQNGAHGDYSKIWTYLSTQEGNGAMAILVLAPPFLFYVAVSVACVLSYWFRFYHGCVIGDTVTRLTAQVEKCPHDSFLTASEVEVEMIKSRRGIHRVLRNEEFAHIVDGKLRTLVHSAVYTIPHKKGVRMLSKSWSLFRHFLIFEDGSAVELTGRESKDELHPGLRLVLKERIRKQIEDLNRE